MHYFIACMVGDSAYIKPINTINEGIKALDPENDFLVFVNGYGKTFEQVVERGFKINKRYNINMIMFDWPTDYRPLRKTAHNAHKIAGNLAIVITSINYPEAEPSRY